MTTENDKIQLSDMEVKIEQISKSEKFFEFYFDKKRILHLQTIFNEENRTLILHCMDFADDVFENNRLEVVLKSLMQAVLLMQVNEWIIYTLPLDASTYENVAGYYSNLYGEAVKFYSKEGEPERKLVRITIKNIKRSHYVQQAYLRTFSSNRKIWKKTGNKKKARIYCFNKKTNSEFIFRESESETRYGPKIEAIAQSKGYYSLPIEFWMRNTLEKDFPPILLKIVNSKSIENLTMNEKMIISQYIVLQYSRTKEIREQIKEASSKLLPIYYNLRLEERGEERLPKETKIKYSNDALRLEHEKIMLKMLRNKNINSLLLSFEWILIRAKKNYWFCTSDHPVIMYNSHVENQNRMHGIKTLQIQTEKILSEKILENREDGPLSIIQTDAGGMRGRGFFREGLEIYLPISPHLCLCLIDRQPDSKLLSIGGINREIVLQSDETIYSHKRDFSYIKKVISDYPDVIKKDGKRVEVQEFSLKNKKKKKK